MKKQTLEQYRKEVTELGGKVIEAQIALQQSLDMLKLALELRYIPSVSARRAQDLVVRTVDASIVGIEKALHHISARYSLAVASSDECGREIKAAGYRATKKKGARRG